MQLLTHVMFQTGEARAAAEHYAGLPDAELLPGDGEIRVRIAGHEVILFDSPVHHEFGLTPAMSLFLEVDEPEQVDAIVEHLTAGGGTTLMPVGEYPFAKRFGWCVDRFGVSWQIAHR